ncbi:hypothetical protein AKJ57_03955 [candidate division MSBL1 archaeon SCGC-AAA259A05]|uniref:Glycosyltransferase 2-like domain-containing protein n=1 Tax=candidate division MSBL1 archaeon SCGC-AAA259A05 TaxID=1698259 RepID=A0A133U939_9EURY|nr:hypothetical protein AKJ57_03955 [candidate division MSBL1 archaeon SCGC-AAA259A05]
MSFDDVTIGTTSILRKKCLERLMKSIEQSDYDGRIIFVDQNKEPLNLDEFDLEIEHIHEPDCGFGTAHNIVADHIETEYMFWVDDDMIFNENGLKRLLMDMENHPKLGWVSPTFDRDFTPGRRLRIENNTLLKEKVDLDGLTYCDMPANGVSLWRTSLYEDVQWEEHLKTGAMHMAIAMKIKNSTDWKTAVEERVVFKHRPIETKDYKNLRNRKNSSMEWFKEEYNVDKIKTRKDLNTKIKDAIELGKDILFNTGRRNRKENIRILKKFLQKN